MVPRGVEPRNPRCKRGSLPLAYETIKIIIDNLKITINYRLLKFINA